MIGEFARRCRLPVSTLRYYDKIGLLRPAAVDSRSGYRRYTAGQLSDALLISRLRAIGTSPHDIAAALLGGAPAAAVLAAERRRVAGQVADRQWALAAIDDLLTDHLLGPAPSVEIVSLVRDRVVTAPFLAAHTDITSTVLRAIADLRRVLRRTGHDRTGPWGATFPLEITEQVSGFVFAHTSQPVDHPALTTAWLPATQVARTVHHGSPETLAAAYDAALVMIENRGWTAADPVIEEYLTLDTAPGADSSIRLSVPIV
jgi:DNA-binding transcriptional MerR regulator